MNASPDQILAEKNAIQLFITGAYRSAADKPISKELKALQKDALAAAGAGDAAGAQAAIKQFVAIAELRELDNVEGSTFNPTQRRNLGAPETATIQENMGRQAFALYQPTPDSANPFQPDSTKIKFD